MRFIGWVLPAVSGCVVKAEGQNRCWVQSGVICHSAFCWELISSAVQFLSNPSHLVIDSASSRALIGEMGSAGFQILYSAW